MPEGRERAVATGFAGGFRLGEEGGEARTRESLRIRRIAWEGWGPKKRRGEGFAIDVAPDAAIDVASEVAQTRSQEEGRRLEVVFSLLRPPSKTPGMKGEIFQKPALCSP